jgi:hypothetical protein
MTDRRRRAASPRHYEISGSATQPADQRWLDTVRLHRVDRETGRSLIARRPAAGTARERYDPASLARAPAARTARDRLSMS